MTDLTAPKLLHIQIRDDGKVVWINTEEKCVLRASEPSTLRIEDKRPHQWMADTYIGLNKLMSLYRPESDAWANVCESRRLLEYEMRYHGNYTDKQIEALNDETDY